jgi:feruloyl esterase
LTPKQVTAVEALWSGVKDSSGDLVYPGLVPGGEADPGGWARWVTGSDPFGSIHWRAADGFFKHMVFDDPEWDSRTFDYDTDLAYTIEKLGPALDANDPDLRALRDRGGKLIVYHGWSDADISPLATIDYYQQVVSEMASTAEPEAGLAEVQEFFRLFMVPGMGHCRGGPGPDQFDALSALEAWVEDGVAPDRLIASKVQDGEVVRSRPLCPFPQVAEWTGSGSTDDAANFVCAARNLQH